MFKPLSVSYPALFCLAYGQFQKEFLFFKVSESDVLSGKNEATSREMWAV